MVGSHAFHSPVRSNVVDHGGDMQGEDMSIVSQALEKKITWGTAAGQIVQWFQQIAGRMTNDPIASQAINDLQMVVKQGASNALALAETELAPAMAEATKVIEAAADAALTKVTGGVGLLAVPLVNSGIEQVIATLQSVLQEKELEWKAKLLPVNSSATQAPKG